ncbi:MAG: Ig-like domain-containing protein [Bacteroidales bacterium]|nr:Ig-like domain-containing protein [Candidatus Cryptobacteroides fimicaballi]
MLNNYDGKWYCKAYASNGRIEITSSVTSYTVKPFSTYVSATVPDFKSGIGDEAVVEFSVTAVWGVSLSECGVCYGTDKSSLSIEHDHISAGSSTGTHTVTITGLKVGQEYFVCSYAREGENVVYSQACSFVVISAPEIKTSSPTQIESSSAVCGGYDIISKGSEITGKGVVWGTSHNPDVEKTYSKSAGSGSEPFSCTLSGLKPVTTYYVRAYAKNKVGIGYGEEITFTTLPIYVSGVELNKTSITITEGDNYTLSASVKPSDATDKSVNWSSSNTSVATVDQSGKVTAVKAGSATITVTTTDGGYTATCNVTVKKRVEDEDGGNEDYDEEVIEW